MRASSVDLNCHPSEVLKALIAVRSKIGNRIPIDTKNVNKFIFMLSEEGTVTVYENLIGDAAYSSPTAMGTILLKRANSCDYSFRRPVHSVTASQKSTGG